MLSQQQHRLSKFKDRAAMPHLYIDDIEPCVNVPFTTKRQTTLILKLTNIKLRTIKQPRGKKHHHLHGNSDFPLLTRDQFRAKLNHLVVWGAQASLIRFGVRFFYMLRQFIQRCVWGETLNMLPVRVFQIRTSPLRTKLAIRHSSTNTLHLQTHATRIAGVCLVVQ